MRIIAGKLKGSKIFTAQKNQTRPLKDLVKESIFNLLIHSNKISFDLEKSKILDLFSGTGSFGLECMSRQAKSVHFVEKEKNAVNILKKNIKKLKMEDNTKIFFDDVFKFLEKNFSLKFRYDLIFCDPPFKEKEIIKLFDLIFNKSLLKKDGILIFHRNKKTIEQLPNFLKILDERNYGISKITFCKILS